MGEQGLYVDHQSKSVVVIRK